MLFFGSGNYLVVVEVVSHMRSLRQNISESYQHCHVISMLLEWISRIWIGYTGKVWNSLSNSMRHLVPSLLERRVWNIIFRIILSQKFLSSIQHLYRREFVCGMEERFTFALSKHERKSDTKTCSVSSRSIVRSEYFLPHRLIFSLSNEPFSILDLSRLME